MKLLMESWRKYFSDISQRIHELFMEIQSLVGEMEGGELRVAKKIMLNFAAEVAEVLNVKAPYNENIFGKLLGKDRTENIKLLRDKTGELLDILDDLPGEMDGIMRGDLRKIAIWSLEFARG